MIKNLHAHQISDHGGNILTHSLVEPQHLLDGLIGEWKIAPRDVLVLPQPVLALGMMVDDGLGECFANRGWLLFVAQVYLMELAGNYLCCVVSVCFIFQRIVRNFVCFVALYKIVWTSVLEVLHLFALRVSNLASFTKRVYF